MFNWILSKPEPNERPLKCILWRDDEKDEALRPILAKIDYCTSHMLDFELKAERLERKAKEAREEAARLEEMRKNFQEEYRVENAKWKEKGVG